MIEATTAPATTATDTEAFCWVTTVCAWEGSANGAKTAVCGSQTRYVVPLEIGGLVGAAVIVAKAKISPTLLEADSSANNTASEAEASAAWRALDAEAWMEKMALEAEAERMLAES